MKGRPHDRWRRLVTAGNKKKGGGGARLHGSPPWWRIAVATEVNITERKLGGGGVGGGESRNDCMK